MQSATAIAAGGSSGDHDSESKIIKQHKKRIRWVAIPFSGRGVDLEDLVQEGCIALIEVSRKWDSSKGVQLWTYARPFVFGAIFKFVAREMNPTNELVNDPDDESEFWTQIAVHPSPEEVAQLGEDLTILEEEIDALNEDERRLLWSVFGEDKSLRDVAAEAATHHCTTQRLYKGAIEKLRERMQVRA